MLEKISSPKDIKALSDRDVAALTGQIREKIISTVSENGGHLASNLGIVGISATRPMRKMILPSAWNPFPKILWDISIAKEKLPALSIQPVMTTMISECSR